MNPRRQLLTSFLASCLLAVWMAAPAGAQDFGGPRPSVFTLALQTEVQERDVVDRGDPLVGGEFKGDAVSNRFLIRGGLQPVPVFELYGLVGGVDLRIDDFNDFDSGLDLAYGLGFQLVLFESPYPQSLRFFWDTQFLRFVVEDRISEPIEQDETIRWNEVVTKIGVASANPLFRPYGGLRFSLVRAKDLLDISGKLSLREDDNVGIFGGVDIYLEPTKAVALNLEFSLIDVNSFRAGFQFAF